jgi:hypothetical protein
LSAGTGRSTSSTRKTSGPPYSAFTTARIGSVPLLGSRVVEVAVAGRDHQPVSFPQPRTQCAPSLRPEGRIASAGGKIVSERGCQ